VSETYRIGAVEGVGVRVADLKLKAANVTLLDMTAAVKLKDCDKRKVAAAKTAPKAKRPDYDSVRKSVMRRFAKTLAALAK
jgi:hypothetical protein